MERWLLGHASSVCTGGLGNRCFDVVKWGCEFFQKASCGGYLRCVNVDSAGGWSC